MHACFSFAEVMVDGDLHSHCQQGGVGHGTMDQYCSPCCLLKAAHLRSSAAIVVGLADFQGDCIGPLMA